MKLEIPESDLIEEYIRPASGPGGQHVNRTSNSVRLSFNFRTTEFLDEGTKERLSLLGGSKINGDFLVITAKEYRSLQANRDAARERLYALLEAARRVPKKRRPTKATKASKERRLASKSRRGVLKAMRSGKNGSDPD